MQLLNLSIHRIAGGAAGEIGTEGEGHQEAAVWALGSAFCPGVAGALRAILCPNTHLAKGELTTTTTTTRGLLRPAKATHAALTGAT